MLVDVRIEKRPSALLPMAFNYIFALKGGDGAAIYARLLLRCRFFIRIVDNVLAVGLHAVVLFF